MLHQATIALNNVYETMYREPRRMSDDGLASLRSNMLRFWAFWKAWGGHLVHKHHMCVHLVERSFLQGNTKSSWTYADEGENRTMSRVAKTLHGGSTFYERLLEKVLPEVC